MPAPEGMDSLSKQQGTATAPQAGQKWRAFGYLAGHVHRLFPEQTMRMDLLRGPKQSRVNLRTILKGGIDHVPQTPVSLDFSTIPLNRFDNTNPALLEAKKRWVQTKEERIGMLVFYTSDMWKKTMAIVHDVQRKDPTHIGLEKRTEDGTYEPVVMTDVAVDPVIRLSAYSIKTMEHGALLWERENSQTPGYRRYKEILTLGMHLGATGPAEDSPKAVIEQGISTAVKTVWGVFDVIPRVYEAKHHKTISQEQLTSIASESLPLILHIAAGNQDLSSSLIDALLEDSNSSLTYHRFKPKYFTFEEVNGKLTLQLNRKAERALARRLYELHGPLYPTWFQKLYQALKSPHRVIVGESVPSSITTGCPFIFAEGTKAGTSAQKEMFQWSLDLAKRFYFPTFPSQQAA